MKKINLDGVSTELLNLLPNPKVNEDKEPIEVSLKILKQFSEITDSTIAGLQSNIYIHDLSKNRRLLGYILYHKYNIRSSIIAFILGQHRYYPAQSRRIVVKNNEVAEAEKLYAKLKKI